MIAYHDTEWGVPLRDERKLFEFMVLDAFQAGLSWVTILRKREAFREAFDGFDPERIARFTAKRVEGLLSNPGIVRNRQKIEATIGNAKALLHLRKEGPNLSELLWSFVDDQPKQNAWCAHGEIPAQTPESDAMSRELRRRGFAFVGPTICYAFMQAAGLVNDHVVECFRHREVRRLSVTTSGRPTRR
jgi:DNA-3-methyladenine glycosylase I